MEEDYEWYSLISHSLGRITSDLSFISALLLFFNPLPAR